jgi:hypothetical protein
MERWRTNQKHCAPPERGTIGKTWDYKHLAPLERKQLPVLHFQVESARYYRSMILVFIIRYFD